MRKAPTFKPGDRIALSAAHLKAIGDYSKASADRRGTVLEVFPACNKATGAHYFTWRQDGDDDSADPRGGLSSNFCLVSRISIDAALA